MMTIQEALAYIHSIYWRGSKLGLERITELLDRMGNPQDALRFVHVAGTNGKGSTCAMLAAVFQRAEYRTGLYISPYLTRFNERMQIDGREIADGQLCAITEYVRDFAEQMTDLPTEFEIVCAIAFEYFKRERCDLVVLEVGLGGRLDATNVIRAPLCSVITTIDYDHTQYLGDTLAQIAAEKAGIIKGGAVVSDAQQPEAMAVLERRCRELDCTFRVVRPENIELLESSLDGQRFRYNGAPYEIALLGRHQLRNAAVVLETIAAVRAAGIAVPEPALTAGLRAARWPGRFEVLRRRPPAVVDGGHNPQGVRAAVEAASEYLGPGLVVLVGVLADKDVDGMLRELDRVAARYVATMPDYPRALDAGKLAEKLAVFGKPVAVKPNVAEACAEAERLCGADGAILALGSLYMAGEIRAYFLKEN